MKQKLKQILRESYVSKAVRAVENFLAEFVQSGKIGRWFLSEGEVKPRNAWLHRLIDGKFGDFLRSGKLFALIFKIPEVAWGMMMLTVLAAMCMPTLAVMLLSLGTLVLTILSVFFYKKRVPPMSSVMILWAIWFVITAVYTVIGYGGSQGILAGGIRLVMLPLLPCAAILIDSEQAARRTAGVVCFGAFAVGGYGLYQYLFQSLSAKWTDTDLFGAGFGRLTSTFENPNIYGEFLLIAMPLALVMTCISRGKRAKILYGAVTLITAVNLLLTYSRGCYISLALILLILLCCKGRYWIWPGLAAVAFSPFYLPQSVVSRIASIGNLADTSVSYRLNIYKGCLSMLSKYWWMGVGIGDSAFRSIYETYALKAVEDAPHAHNLFLQTMCETGVIGLIVLLGLLILSLRSALSHQYRAGAGAARWMRLVLVASWVGLLLQGMTDFIFYNNNLFAIMMVSLGAMICTGREVQNEQ